MFVLVCSHPTSQNLGIIGENSRRHDHDFTYHGFAMVRTISQSPVNLGSPESCKNGEGAQHPQSDLGANHKPGRMVSLVSDRVVMLLLLMLILNNFAATSKVTQHGFYWDFLSR